MGARRRVATIAAGIAAALLVAVVAPVTAFADDCAYADGVYSSSGVNTTVSAAHSPAAGKRFYVIAITVAHSGSTQTLWTFDKQGSTLFGGYIGGGTYTQTFSPPLDIGTVSGQVTLSAAGLNVNERVAMFGYDIASGAANCSVNVTFPSNQNVTVTNAPTVNVSPTPLPVSCTTGCSGGSGGNVTLAGFTGEGQDALLRVIEALGLVVLLLAARVVIGFARRRAG